jgi:hypothetical protein
MLYSLFGGNVEVSKWLLGGILVSNLSIVIPRVQHWQFYPCAQFDLSGKIKISATDFVEIKPRRSNRQANV